ncbi:MAG TPA: signal peptidase I [Bryobacteraceae bacterium]|nr:signal peptidase I [Bryobacteraceae bacterium]
MEPEQEPIVLSAPPAAPRPAAGLGPISLLRDVAISVALAVILIVFIYQPVKVEGTSMMPGLTDQERIFVNKYEYRLGENNIQRGDLVVFHYPKDPRESYIKRVVGLPGDSVRILAGEVYVNGKKLDEPYVLDAYRDHDSMEREIVPPGDYFVLGDHRNSSSDSRSWGFVARDEIYGKAVLVYWPLAKIGRVH